LFKGEPSSTSSNARIPLVRISSFSSVDFSSLIFFTGIMLYLLPDMLLKALKPAPNSSTSGSAPSLSP
jgi:hypothetical protein